MTNVSAVVYVAVVECSDLSPVRVLVLDLGLLAVRVIVFVLETQLA